MRITDAAVDRWIAANPLRRWRDGRGYSEEDASHETGFSVLTLMTFELGVVIPTPEEAARLGVLIGADYHDWLRWHNSIFTNTGGENE